MAFSSSSPTRQWKYDVFLSFRGEDTRNNFTSHLYAALCQKKVETFMDNQLRRGEEITQAISKAIEESKISIIVFSEAYAASSWCLDELLKILQCKKANGHMIIPVFYRVNPADVRKQAGSYAKAFTKHAEQFKEKIEKVKMWRAALKEVANLSGWHLQQQDRPEAILIEEIVKDILVKLNHMSSSNAEGLVGIEPCIQELKELLCIQLTDVCIVGIWGKGGIGKTTIAGEIFNHISSQFEGCWFVANVREESNRRGLVHLRNELLSEILKQENLYIGSPNIGVNFIKDRLRRKKVLIVLDDVNNSEQVELLAGARQWFGQGSRIIITTRDKKVLKSVVDDIYEVKALSQREALRLFCQYAFKSDHPTEDNIELSKRVVKYADGIPLALKVLGSFLFGRSKRDWESALKKLEKTPNIEIQNVLKISYDGLDDEEKDIFCDIACFFKGKDKAYVTSILDGCGFCTEIGISVLIDKSLITISHNKLMMHDLLQVMGWEIVRQESIKEPGNRSRIWIPGDVYHVLTKNTGTKKVQGIFLDMDKIREMHLHSEAFLRMCNLRLLKFYHSHNHKGFEADCKHLVNLKRIDLSHSRHLKELPDFSKTQNLEIMILEGCTSLIEVPQSVRYLQKLLFLNLRNCTRMKRLPSSIHFESLETLTLSGCSKLKKLPEILGIIRYLCLDGTAMRELPASIQFLGNLVSLHLHNCTRLKILPSSIYNLKSLKIIDLLGCSNLTKFPEISKNMERLYLGGTGIEEVPSSIECLSQLVSLNLSNCRRLKKFLGSLQYLKSLRFLDLSGCVNLVKSPEISGTIEYLCLSGTAIEEVPSSIGCLSGLHILNLAGCKRLQSLPTSICKLKSLREINLFGCSRLEKFPEILETMKHLQSINLTGTAIKAIPSSFEHLNLLSSLWLRSCRNLSKLPHNFKSSIKHVKYLDLSDCNILKIPSDLGYLPLLHDLNLSGNGFERLPESIKQLSCLRRLDLSYCKKLQSLPELPRRLQHIDTHNCTSLKSVLILSTVLMEDSFNFILTNCIKLDQNACGKILTHAQLRIQLIADASLKYYHQGFYQTPSASFCFPGSEIPKWFDCQSMRSSITIQLPQRWCDTKLLGFSFCAVVAFSDNFNDRHFYLRCEYHLRTSYNDRIYHNSIFQGQKHELRYVGSDHVYLWHDFRLDPKTVEVDDGVVCSCKNCYIEASFDFYPMKYYISPLQCCKVKKCGVKLYNTQMMRRRKI